MSILKVDEKWSIEYDPKNNDRPVAWLRYENKSHPFDHVNAVTAMFYALLEDRTKLAKAVEALQWYADFGNHVSETGQPAITFDMGGKAEDVLIELGEDIG